MDESGERPVDRRGFIKGSAVGAAALAAPGKVMGEQTEDGSVQSADAHDHGHGHDHGHDHDHDHQDVPSDIALRVRALESVLTEKGMVDPAALDEIVDAFENRIGPQNGARVVARAWVDPGFRDRLLTDGTSAIGELDYLGGQGEHMKVVANTDTVHNLIVCTLCSCYPWPTLGLPPVWYKSSAYRARAVIEPREVLREFGLDLPGNVEVRVWDSTAEIRYLVLPQRPPGTDHMTEEELAELVTRDSMVGVARIAAPSSPGGGR